MKKPLTFIVGFAICLILIRAQPSRSIAAIEGPVRVITAEYVPYSRLIEPDLVRLFKKYGVAICLCVREDQLGDDLDRLYKVYEEAGIRILFWPLLPRKHGLYLNKSTTGVYLDYLDVIFNWAQENGHKIEALVADVEPSAVEPEPGKKPPGFWRGFARVIKAMDDASFQASIPEFNKIIRKLHSHDCLAVAAAFPFVVDDRLKGTHSWEDLFGGPIATVDWDYIAIMMYTTWFVETGGAIGLDWDAAHYLAYEYSRDMKAIWGDRAAVAVGVTNPGEGHEVVVYTSAEQMAPAVAAVKAAGIEGVGIYSLKGMLDSGDVESWLKMLIQTAPAVPDRGKRAARRFRRMVRGVGKILEVAR